VRAYTQLIDFADIRLDPSEQYAYSSRPKPAKIDLHQIDSGPTGRLGPKLETSRSGPKTTKEIDFTKIDSTRRSCLPTAPGRNRPKSTEAKSSRAIATNPRLRH